LNSDKTPIISPADPYTENKRFDKGVHIKEKIFRILDRIYYIYQ
jgi:hypothetical protein